jgi:hypothetical protein
LKASEHFDHIVWQRLFQSGVELDSKLNPDGARARRYVITRRNRSYFSHELFSFTESR